MHSKLGISNLVKKLNVNNLLVRSGLRNDTKTVGPLGPLGPL